MTKKTANSYGLNNLSPQWKVASDGSLTHPFAEYGGPNQRLKWGNYSINAIDGRSFASMEGGKLKTSCGAEIEYAPSKEELVLIGHSNGGKDWQRAHDLYSIPEEFYVEAVRKRVEVEELQRKEYERQNPTVIAALTPKGYEATGGRAGEVGAFQTVYLRAVTEHPDWWVVKEER